MKVVIDIFFSKYAYFSVHEEGDPDYSVRYKDVEYACYPFEDNILLL